MAAMQNQAQVLPAKEAAEAILLGLGIGPPMVVANEMAPGPGGSGVKRPRKGGGAGSKSSPRAPAPRRLVNVDAQYANNPNELVQGARGPAAALPLPPHPLPVPQPHHPNPAPARKEEAGKRDRFDILLEACNVSKEPKRRKRVAARVNAKWTPEDDTALQAAVDELGAKDWKTIAKRLEGTRTDIQCLNRWNKVTKPGLVKVRARGRGGGAEGQWKRGGRRWSWDGGGGRGRWCASEGARKIGT